MAKVFGSVKKVGRGVIEFVKGKVLFALNGFKPLKRVHIVYPYDNCGGAPDYGDIPHNEWVRVEIFCDPGWEDFMHYMGSLSYLDEVRYMKMKDAIALSEQWYAAFYIPRD